jgi:hypothetical protein
MMPYLGHSAGGGAEEGGAACGESMSIAVTSPLSTSAAAGHAATGTPKEGSVAAAPPLSLTVQGHLQSLRVVSTIVQLMHRECDTRR